MNQRFQFKMIVTLSQPKWIVWVYLRLQEGPSRPGSIWCFFFLVIFFMHMPRQKQHCGAIMRGCCVSFCCWVLGGTLTLGSAYLAVLDLHVLTLIFLCLALEKGVFVSLHHFFLISFLKISYNKFSYVFNVVIWLDWDFSVKFAICLNNSIVLGVCVTTWVVFYQILNHLLQLKVKLF